MVAGEVVRCGICFGRETNKTGCWNSCEMMRDQDAAKAFRLRALYTNVLTEKGKPSRGAGLGEGRRVAVESRSLFLEEI